MKDADGLTPKQAAFVREYCIDHNGKQAAIRSGYNPVTAESQASTLLSYPKVAAVVARLTQSQTRAADLTAIRTLEEMRRLAFSDVRSLFDAQGKLKPIHTLTAEEAACIGSIEVIVKNAEAGDGHTDTVHKIKCWDKPRTLEMLGKHFALLVEHVNVTVENQLNERLMAARKRTE